VRRFRATGQFVAVVAEGLACSHTRALNSDPRGTADSLAAVKSLNN